LVFFFFFGFIEESNGQFYIGKHKDEIVQKMNTDYKSFKLNTSTVNQYYKYLKYEDPINEITILFFLSDEDKCTLVRKMCDYSNINDELKYMNTTYIPDGKNKWKYKYEGTLYAITMEEGEWFFTITTKLSE
jgi:hypothetical protein